jgi:hypothetical protein
MLFLNESAYGVASDGKELEALLEECGIKDDCEQVEGSETGALALALEMETSWHAIEREMIFAEHGSIVNEDTALLEGAMADYWKKVKDFFVKLWNKAKAFFQKVVDKLTGYFQDAEKWFVKNEKDMAESAKCTTYKSVASGVAGQNVDKAGQDFQGKLASATKKDEVEAVKKDVDEWKAFGGDKAEELEVKKSSIAVLLHGTSKALAGLKKANQIEVDKIKKAIAETDAAAKISDAKNEEIKTSKEKIEGYKAAISLMKSVNSKYISYYKSAVSEGLKCAKALLREGKK